MDDRTSRTTTDSQSVRQTAYIPDVSTPSTQSSISLHTFNTYNKTKKRRPEGPSSTTIQLKLRITPIPEAATDERYERNHRHSDEYTRCTVQQSTTTTCPYYATDNITTVAAKALIVRRGNR
ncbi:hypothetical protein QTP88_008276 [Uroleucon formosanum]